MFGIALFVGLYLSACALVYRQQRKIIFQPTRELITTPVDLRLPFQDIWISVGSEVNSPQPQRIHGWWIPAAGKPRGTLLYLHGNGFNISANLGLARRFQQLGLSVLMIDYRGYGRSDGDFPSEAWVYEDARAAWSYLTKDLAIPTEEIVVFGHSLGGAIAIDLMSEQRSAAGLIVQSSFSSMTNLARTQGWPNAFPLSLLLNQRFDSIQKVPKLDLPTLWLHGEDDGLIPADMSRDLFQASVEPKTLKIFPGANHNDVADVGGDRYDALIADALETWLMQTSVSTP